MSRTYRAPYGQATTPQPVQIPNPDRGPGVVGHKRGHRAPARCADCDGFMVLYRTVAQDWHLRCSQCDSVKIGQRYT